MDNTSTVDTWTDTDSVYDANKSWTFGQWEEKTNVKKTNKHVKTYVKISTYLVECSGTSLLFFKDLYLNILRHVRRMTRMAVKNRCLKTFH